MRSSNIRTKLSGLAAAAFLAIVCIIHEPLVNAQAGADIPVLVMGEDEDPTTVKRSSDIFKRVIAELRGAMQRHGFRMIDEESVAVDLGWAVRDRRSKVELIEAIKLMNKSGLASHQVRAWVLFRIHAQAKQLSFSTKIQVRIDGEIYDAASNQFLDTFEMPRKAYPAPIGCLKSSPCITEVVGDRAREAAGSLGTVLAHKLKRYTPLTPLTPYTVTLRYFGDREAMTIVKTMIEEFPGYRSHNLIEKSASLWSYEYLTTAKASKLAEWLHILLREMDFEAGRETLVQMQGNEVLVDKLAPTRNHPKSTDKQRRFRK